MIQVNGINESGGGIALYLKTFPDECPYCFSKIFPRALYSYILGENASVFFACTNTTCQQCFVGKYTSAGNNQYDFICLLKASLQSRVFDEIINEKFYNFVSIYKEAYSAEQQGLLQICGVGYRKALEFLIKDYLIEAKPEDREKILKKALGNCINEDIEDNNIKEVAKRATWLGNDETHYVREWGDKDLKDLKNVIDLVVYWIEYMIRTKQLVIDMPEKKKVVPEAKHKKEYLPKV